jgi:hypothetical protein
MNWLQLLSFFFNCTRTRHVHKCTKIAFPVLEQHIISNIYTAYTLRKIVLLQHKSFVGKRSQGFCVVRIQISVEFMHFLETQKFVF